MATAPMNGSTPIDGDAAGWLKVVAIQDRLPVRARTGF